MIDITPYVKINDMSQIKLNTLMLFRCTTLEYANKFLEKGNIRFGRPQEWIDYYESHGAGRGDLLEGAFAAIKELDERAINFYKTIRPHVKMTASPVDGFYYFQSEDVLNMPTFCLFGLNDNMFPTQERAEDKKLYPTGIISKKYFSDLFPDITKANYDSLEPNQKPVLLMINNPHMFLERIRASLRDFGLENNEFIVHPVGYMNKQEQFFVGDPMPGELFMKDSAFDNQSEIRIVITSTRKEIVDKLKECNGIVNIGAMGDIAELQEYYFDDFQMQLRGNSLLFTLPKPISTLIDDPLPLMELVHQALRDELPGPSMSVEELEKYIAQTIETLENRFDIIFDRNHLTFHKKDNSQSWELRNIWDALFLHGWNYFNEKDYVNSTDSYSKAIKIDPSRPEAWYNRACSFYWLKKYDEMFSDMDEAIKLAPENSKYLTERALMMQKIKDKL